MRPAVEDKTCIRARRTLSLALDGEAGTADVLTVAAHIRCCEGCYRFAVQIVEFTRELRSVRLGRLESLEEIDYSSGERS